MYRYATGHVERSTETQSLRDLHDAFEESGYRVKALMRDIVMNPGFREAAAPEEGE